MVIFVYFDDVTREERKEYEKRKQVLTCSRIGERDKKNTKYYDGDYFTSKYEVNW